MPRITVTATIPAGQSLSDVINLSEGAAVFLHMPQAWTPAQLTFQISPDGVIFNNAADLTTTREIAFNVLPGTSIRLPGEWESAATGFMKLRSGSSTNPVAQIADRTIIISALS
jgi:hypothetical protein